MTRCFLHRHIALVALGALAIPMDARRVAADELVPFRCRAAEIVTDVTPLGPGLLQITSMATGEATHLGRFTGTETVILNLADGTFSGTRVFVAANGDLLHAAVEGAFTSATTEKCRRVPWPSCAYVGPRRGRAP